jgi:hypothetical protein
LLVYFRLTTASGLSLMRRSEYAAAGARIGALVIDVSGLLAPCGIRCDCAEGGFGRAMPADSLNVETFAAMQLLGRVANGEQPFDGEQRQWAIVEGIELSGWSMTEVQLVEGGDAELANRVLRFACRRDSEQATRQLTPLPKARDRQAAAQKAVTSHPAVSDVPDPDLLRRVARGSATLAPAQRESLMIEAMVLSGGKLSSADLLHRLDSALAKLVLRSATGGDEAMPA